MILSDTLGECYFCTRHTWRVDDTRDIYLCGRASCVTSLVLEESFTAIRANRSVCTVNGARCINYNDCPIMQDTVPTYRRLAEDPSVDEYWGLDLPRFDERDSGDEDRVLAYEDLKYTGYDSQVVDGILGECDPYEDHLFEPRDHFEGNPHFDLDEGKPTASALFVWTEEELTLTPEEVDEARPYHVTRETMKPPNEETWCSLFEHDSAGHTLKPEGDQTMWSVFDKLEYHPRDPEGKKVRNEYGDFERDTEGNHIYTPYKKDRNGWIYMGRATVILDLPEVKLPNDAGVFSVKGQRVTLFISERNGHTSKPEYKAGKEEYPTSVNWNLGIKLGDGLAEWCRRMKVHGKDLSKYHELTWKDYEAQLKVIAARKLTKSNSKAKA